MSDNHSNLYKVLSGLILNQGRVFASVSAMVPKTNAIILSGDGTHYLADDGEYKTVSSSSSLDPSTIDLSAFQNGTGFMRTSDIYENGTTIIDSSHLPSYVDDVIEGYFNTSNSAFYEESTFVTLITGDRSKIYLDLTSGKNEIYRYSGSQFVSISEVNGSTDSQMYNDFYSLYNLFGQLSAAPNGRLSGYTVSESIKNDLMTGRLSAGLTVTQTEKNTWNSKLDSSALNGYATTTYVDDATSTKMTTPAGGTSGQFLMKTSNGYAWVDAPSSGGEDSSTEIGTNYLLFKIPNNTDSGIYNNLYLTFSNSDDFQNVSSVTLQNNAANFTYGHENNRAFTPITDFVTLGLPSQLSNCVLRYNLSSLMQNPTISSYNRFTYQWVSRNLAGDNTTSGVLGFGMTDAAIQIFDNDFNDINDKIDALSSAISDVVEQGQGALNPVFTTASATSVSLQANTWYYILDSTVSKTMTLPSTATAGDLIKITVNSVSLSGKTIQISNTNPLKGETSSGWGTITPFILDVPETITMVYSSQGWCLVEFKKL